MINLKSTLTLVFCLALSPVLHAASEIDENTYKPLASMSFPGGCDNAFAEAKKFRDFFESTISLMAAERGATAKGISDLFATSELSQHLLDLKPAYFEESPVDRLMKSQLCKFEEVYKAERKPGVESKEALTSNNPLLHDHLAKVSSKLFKDAYRIVEQAAMEKAKEKQQEEMMQGKAKEVDKARKLGREKVEPLF
jgi:hypothetical protein